MLELVRITRFKLFTTFVIALSIHLHGWIKPRVLTYYVENSEFMSRKPELQKLFQEFFLMVQGDLELVRRITVQSFATNLAVIILLSYTAACIIAKMKITQNRSAGIFTAE